MDKPMRVERTQRGRIKRIYHDTGVWPATCIEINPRSIKIGIGTFEKRLNLRITVKKDGTLNVEEWNW